MNDLERLDHTLEDLETEYDFAVAAEGTANERAAWEARHDELVARSTLYPRARHVTAAPIDPPIKKAPRAVNAGAMTQP